MKQKRLLSLMLCILLLSGCGSPHDSPAESALTLRVYFADEGEVRLLPLEDYVLGAAAAEMPANYAPEALKCQAVAARTRAVAQSRAFGGNGCTRHPDCDICTDSACCQAYQTDSELQARWGSEYAILRARIDRAVRATGGLLLTSGGLPIEVLYHACSGGKTEDAAAVFASAKPYLVSVDSPGEEGYAGFRADTSFACEEAADLLLRAFPDCGITADALPSALRLQSTTVSGRVATLLVGNQVVRGVDFRRALNLRSTYFTWEADGDRIIFHTVGYGHGVGLSQAGAQAMAADGADFAEILAHYYPGTQLTRMDNTPISGS